MSWYYDENSFDLPGPLREFRGHTFPNWTHRTHLEDHGRGVLGNSSLNWGLNS